MARRKADVVIDDDNSRDNGKVFVLTEMPAARSEKWAMRALLALQRAGVEIPDDAVQNGMAGIAGVGIDALGRLSFHEVEYLLDEMFECIEDPHPASQGGARIASGFFAGRQSVEIDAGETKRGMIEYVNVSRAIGAVVSSGMATLRDLDEAYGLEDVYDMLEIISVDAHNSRVLNKKD